MDPMSVDLTLDGFGGDMDPLAVELLFPSLSVRSAIAELPIVMLRLCVRSTQTDGFLVLV